MPRATAVRPIVPQSGDGLRPSIVYVPSCAERISASSGYVPAEALPGRTVMGSFHGFDSIWTFARRRSASSREALGGGESGKATRLAIMTLTNIGGDG